MLVKRTLFVCILLNVIYIFVEKGSFLSILHHVHGTTLHLSYYLTETHNHRCCTKPVHTTYTMHKCTPTCGALSKQTNYLFFYFLPPRIASLTIKECRRRINCDNRLLFCGHLARITWVGGWKLLKWQAFIIVNSFSPYAISRYTLHPHRDLFSRWTFQKALNLEYIYIIYIYR